MEIDFNHPVFIFLYFASLFVGSIFWLNALDCPGGIRKYIKKLNCFGFVYYFVFGSIGVILWFTICLYFYLGMNVSLCVENHLTKKELENE